jgi:hypothetical protein
MLHVMLYVTYWVTLFAKAFWPVCCLLSGAARPSLHHGVRRVQVAMLYFASYVGPWFLVIAATNWVLYVVINPDKWFWVGCVLIDALAYWVYTRPSWLDAVTGNWGWTDEDERRWRELDDLE